MRRSYGARRHGDHMAEHETWRSRSLSALVLPNTHAFGHVGERGSHLLLPHITAPPGLGLNGHRDPLDFFQRDGIPRPVVECGGPRRLVRRDGLGFLGRRNEVFSQGPFHWALCEPMDWQWAESPTRVLHHRASTVGGHSRRSGGSIGGDLHGASSHRPSCAPFFLPNEMP